MRRVKTFIRRAGLNRKKLQALTAHIAPIGLSLLLIASLAGYALHHARQSRIAIPTLLVYTKKMQLPTQGQLKISAAPTPLYEYGFSAGDLVDLNATALASRLADIKSMGAKWVRMDMSWSRVQAAGPTSWNWKDYDRVTTAVQNAGLKMLAILDYTPKWAWTPGCTIGQECAPADTTKFAAYAAAAVARYKTKGVTHWEIWNEPNKAGSWAPKPNPAAYTRLLIATYNAIKAKDAQAFVITGGFSPAYTEPGQIAPSEFLNAMYANGAKGYFDAVGHHPYSYPAPPDYNANWTGWVQMKNLRPIMVAKGDEAKQIWLTEYGAPTGGPGLAASPANNYGADNGAEHVTEALQATMASKAVSLHKSYNWVGPLFWYGYKDLGTDATAMEDFFGLVRHDGTIKPAYNAYTQAIKQ